MTDNIPVKNGFCNCRVSVDLIQSKVIAMIIISANQIVGLNPIGAVALLVTPCIVLLGKFFSSFRAYKKASISLGFESIKALEQYKPYMDETNLLLYHEKINQQVFHRLTGVKWPLGLREAVSRFVEQNEHKINWNTIRRARRYIRYLGGHLFEIEIKLSDTIYYFLWNLFTGGMLVALVSIMMEVLMKGDMTPQKLWTIDLLLLAIVFFLIGMLIGGSEYRSARYLRRIKKMQ